jgi:hypothetical protein
MKFSREHPSPRYRELLEQYRYLHDNGEAQLGLPPERTFSGKSMLPHAGRIKELIVRTGARTILDYGSGKGQQYMLQIEAPGGQTYRDVGAYWNIASAMCYDPCYAPYSRLPTQRFDGVICTDVLEHCPELDMEWILEELFGYADRFVYANVACYPANKHLPNGENAHCTVRPVGWWAELLAKVSARNPGRVWQVWVQTVDDTGVRLQEDCLSG